MRKCLALLLVFLLVFPPNFTFALDSLIEEKDDEVHTLDETEEVVVVSEEVVEEVSEEIKTSDSKLDETETNEKETGENSVKEELVTLNAASVAPMSVAEWYEVASRKGTASERLIAFIEAYEQYPGDHSIVEGINTSARSLLNWATEQHQDQQYDVAVNRYELILTAPALSSSIQMETELKLQYGTNSERVPTADQLATKANGQPTSSSRLELFSLGYYLYMTDHRFEEGINSSARSLLNWAIGQHNEGNFEVARDRYLLILSSPTLRSDIKEETEQRFQLANDKVRLADDIYQVARRQSTASERLALFIEGYELYPEDSRFEEGINKSARSLINWATGQHHDHRYDVAQDRYESILTAPTLRKEIKREIEVKLQYAKVRNLIPTANQLVMNGNGQSSSLDRLEVFTEGYYLYPEDSRFEVGINNSAQSLLNLAISHHRVGEYGVAQDRYELILSSPVLAKDIKDETEYRLSYAKEGIRLSNDFVDFASSQSTSSERLAAFIEGYELYPDDFRFVVGINESAHSLFNWAMEQHQVSHFDIALDRYKTILEAPALDEGIKQEVEQKIIYAQDNKRFPVAEELISLAEAQPSSSPRLEVYVEGYTLFPTDDRFVEGINNNARSLLNWATGQHQDRRFDVAIDRYESILALPIVDPLIRKETENKLIYAKENNRLPSAKQLNNLANEQHSSSPRLEAFIKGYLLYPTDKSFEVGINDSAESLLNWATGQHQDRRYDVAIDRYENILAAPALRQSIKRETEIKLQYANGRQRIPSSNQLSNAASAKGTSSERLETFIEGYYLYSNDSRFRTGIYNSARSLLSWTSGQHHDRRYDVVIERYESILAAPALNRSIRQETELRLKYAKGRNRVPTVNQFLNLANNESSSSGRLSIYNEGLILYPSNNRMRTGVQESAESLFSWAVGRHGSGDYKTAIDRYVLILNSNGVHPFIRSQAQENKKLAENRNRPISFRTLVNGRVQNYTYEKMQRDLGDLQQMYPGFMETSVIGKSVDGRNIYAVKLGYGNTEIFINSSIHAREHMTTNVVMKMIDDYAYAYANDNTYDGFNVRQVLDNTTIWFVPMANPDGVTLVQQGPNAINNKNLRDEAIKMNGGSRNFDSWKANIRGVDLNRNFPTRWNSVQQDPGKPGPFNHKGPKPLSEPESIILADFTRSRDFKTTVAYHSSGEVIFTGSPGPVANLVSRKTGYPVIDTSRNISGGGYNTWFIDEFGRPGLTPEISPSVGHRPVPLANWDKIWRQNDSVGLILADEAFRNRNRR
ncbi:M14 family metallocarboxypeptidase [Evansella sp. AB-P1]|uniref:M14 family metallopeptidase n=1 Tax=Evansella sp. AB-P1 TaxID=3037653 RepID=UPI00241DB5B6|nr:M14 family metallocarboxypeptidase [Evansella sp. AB-P1]MDG5786691.1 M14 family metallocarboxypeptidase [Evansella sp. AB-P1]